MKEFKGKLSGDESRKWVKEKRVWTDSLCSNNLQWPYLYYLSSLITIPSIIPFSQYILKAPWATFVLYQSITLMILCPLSKHNDDDSEVENDKFVHGNSHVMLANCSTRGVKPDLDRAKGCSDPNTFARTWTETRAFWA